MWNKIANSKTLNAYMQSWSYDEDSYLLQEQLLPRSIFGGKICWTVITLLLHSACSQNLLAHAGFAGSFAHKQQTTQSTAQQEPLDILLLTNGLLLGGSSSHCCHQFFHISFFLSGYSPPVPPSVLFSPHSCHQQAHSIVGLALDLAHLLVSTAAASAKGSVPTCQPSAVPAAIYSSSGSFIFLSS